MGLLFQMPVKEDDRDDRIQIKESPEGEKILHLKSYGLPMIFWGYLLAIFSVLFFMILAIKDPLLRALQGEDSLNRFIALAVIFTLVACPLSLLAFYFYEKEIIKKGQSLCLIHRFFFLPVKKVKISLRKEDGLLLKHDLDSPNLAAQNKTPGMGGFENRGHYKIVALSEKGKKPLLVDRNSQRLEMKKLKKLLESY